MSELFHRSTSQSPASEDGAPCETSAGAASSHRSDGKSTTDVLFTGYGSNVESEESDGTDSFSLGADSFSLGTDSRRLSDGCDEAFPVPESEQSRTQGGCPARETSQPVTQTAPVEAVINGSHDDNVYDSGAEVQAARNVTDQGSSSSSPRYQEALRLAAEKEPSQQQRQIMPRSSGSNPSSGYSSSSSGSREKARSVAGPALKQDITSEEQPVDSQAAVSQPSDEDVKSNIKRIMELLPSEAFDSLFDKLAACGISSEMHVNYFLFRMFQSAAGCRASADLHVRLCVSFTDWVAANLKACDWRRLLLNMCQDFFQAALKYAQSFKKSRSGSSQPEVPKKIFKSMDKASMLGFMEFVGKLLKEKLLATKVCVFMAEDLLSAGKLLTFEMLAVLLTSIGENVEEGTPANDAKLDSVVEKIAVLAKSDSLPQHLRSMLQEVMLSHAKRRKAIRCKLETISEEPDENSSPSSGSFQDNETILTIRTPDAAGQ